MEKIARKPLREALLQMPKRKTKEILAHLRRHLIPEIIDDDCLAAFKNIETQYGEAFTYGGALEVRLGDQARYVDYVLAFDEENIPLVDGFFYELDYEQFSSGKTIKPFLFFDVIKIDGSYKNYLDKVLPPFLGEKKAKKFSAPLDKLITALSEDVSIKDIGKMSIRGGYEALRVIVVFKNWKDVGNYLKKIGWQGDIKAFLSLIEPYLREKFSIALTLTENGVAEEIGVEINLGLNEPPEEVDKVITRLEESGLCLKSKGDAIRRWVSMPPEGEPFFQTIMHHFKLIYRGGKIAGAKAYLAQSPQILNYHFCSYYRPNYVDFMLKDESNSLPADKAIKYLRECADCGVHCVHFIGDVLNYEPLNELLTECKRMKLFSTVELSGEVSPAQMNSMIQAGASEFVIDFDGKNPDALKSLREIGFDNFQVRISADGKDFSTIKQSIERARLFGTMKISVSGMICSENNFPPIDLLKKIEKFISQYKYFYPQVNLSAEPCFFLLRTLLNSDNEKKNLERIIRKGCTALRDHFCIKATGKFAPCRYLYATEDFDSIAEYWEKSSELKKFREQEKNRESSCENCFYKNRCLPCPLWKEKFSACPIKQ